MPPKSMLDMPEDEKSRDGQTGAAKTPRAGTKTGPKTKSAEREARLAEALRENLRRRKAGGQSQDEAASKNELKDD